MNTSVYLFGEFNNGYSQYPDDYTSSIFQNFYTNAKATTQIAIYRDGNLMYYGYIRKLQEDRYIGLCVLLNGLMLNRIDGLFSLFENTISNLVCNGQLIHYDEQGELVLKKGKPQADASLRDTENVPLKEDIAEYFKREVLPFASDAWIDEKKSKVGYEIPFTRYFYKYEAPRPSAEIMAEIMELETELSGSLEEVFDL